MPNAPARLTVYYDGACPLCRREIAFYRRQKGAAAIMWIDVAHTTDAAALGDDLSCQAAMARFHVRRADGTLLNGAPAFAALWRSLPHWRWAGVVLDGPVLAPIANGVYGLFLRLRPWLQRRAA